MVWTPLTPTGLTVYALTFETGVPTLRQARAAGHSWDDAVVEAFHEFARLVAPASEGGKLLIAHDGAHRREVTAGVECAVETIGF